MKYAYLFIPAIVCFLLPVLKIAVDEHKAKVRKQQAIAAKEAREAARREAIRKAREQREAEKAAEEAAKAAMPKRKPGRPRKNPLPDQRPETISPAAQPAAQAPEAAPEAIPEAAPKSPATYIGNNAFAGETVAFTGKLRGMTRSEAIEAVKKNGGKAFDSMPASTTILVVGDRPGKNKLDNADKWIGSCRKITALEFDIMLKTPLTLTPEGFADYVHAHCTA